MVGTDGFIRFSSFIWYQYLHSSFKTGTLVCWPLDYLNKIAPIDDWNVATKTRRCTEITGWHKGLSFAIPEISPHRKVQNYWTLCRIMTDYISIVHRLMHEACVGSLSSYAPGPLEVPYLCVYSWESEGDGGGSDRGSTHWFTISLSPAVDRQHLHRWMEILWYLRLHRRDLSWSDDVRGEKGGGEISLWNVVAV